MEAQKSQNNLQPSKAAVAQYERNVSEVEGS